MEWLSLNRGRRHAGGTHTHVYIPARNVGRLDKEYLFGSARSTALDGIGRVRRAAGGNYIGVFASMAAAWLLLVSAWRRMDGHNCYRGGSDSMGIFDLYPGRGFQPNANFTRVCLDDSVGGGGVW